MLHWAVGQAASAYDTNQAWDLLTSLVHGDRKEIMHDTALSFFSQHLCTLAPEAVTDRGWACVHAYMFALGQPWDEPVGDSESAGEQTSVTLSDVRRAQRGREGRRQRGRRTRRRAGSACLGRSLEAEATRADPTRPAAQENRCGLDLLWRLTLGAAEPVAARAAQLLAQLRLQWTAGIEEVRAGVQADIE